MPAEAAATVSTRATARVRKYGPCRRQLEGSGGGDTRPCTRCAVGSKRGGRAIDCTSVVARRPTIRAVMRKPTVRPDRCRRLRPRVSSRELRGSAVEPRGSDDASTSLSTAFYPNSGTQRSSFAHSKRAQRNALRLHLRAFRARDALRATGMPPPCEEVRLAPAACCSGQDRIAILALARRLSLDAPSLACIDMP